MKTKKTEYPDAQARLDGLCIQLINLDRAFDDILKLLDGVGIELPDVFNIGSYEMVLKAVGMPEDSDDFCHDYIINRWAGDEITESAEELLAWLKAEAEEERGLEE